MEPVESAAAHLAHGKLTTIDCVAQSLAVGPIFSAAAIGAILAALSGGVSPFVVILTTIGILGIGYCVAEFAKRYSGSGTVYEFVAHSLGKRPAVFTAGAYHFAALTLGGPGIGIIVGIQAHVFFDSHMGIDIPWWVWGLFFSAVIMVVNIVGVQVSVRTQLTIIGVSVIPFLILIVAVLTDGGPNGLSLESFNPANVAAGGSVFKGLLFGILMFVGFELAAALGEETSDPKRSIPIAVLSTILIVAVFYLITQYVGVIGSGGTTFDFAALGEEYVGRWLSVLIELAVLLDIIAVGIGFQAAVSRGLFTLARDGLLPRPLATTNRRNVPQNAQITIFVVTAIVIFIALAKYGTGALLAPDGSVIFPEEAFWAFLIASTVGGFIICIIYAILCIAALRMFFSTKQALGIVAGIIGLVIAVLGVAAQFIEGTAPTGDAKWGRTLGVIGIIVVALWLVLNMATRPQAVERAGDHTLHHA